MLLAHYRRSANPEMVEQLFCGYVGEVYRRTFGGNWMDTEKYDIVIDNVATPDGLVMVPVMDQVRTVVRLQLPGFSLHKQFRKFAAHVEGRLPGAEVRRSGWDG